MARLMELSTSTLVLHGASPYAHFMISNNHQNLVLQFEVSPRDQFIAADPVVGAILQRDRVMVKVFLKEGFHGAGGVVSVRASYRCEYNRRMVGSEWERLMQQVQIVDIPVEINEKALSSKSKSRMSESGTKKNSFDKFKESSGRPKKKVGGGEEDMVRKTLEPFGPQQPSRQEKQSKYAKETRVISRWEEGMEDPNRVLEVILLAILAGLMVSLGSHLGRILFS